MVTNGPTAELGRSLRSLQTVAFLSVRREDDATVAAAGAAHRPKPPHLNHTALKLGHLGVAWKHLSHSPRLLEALTSPSRPAFSTPHLQNHTKNGLLVGAGSQSYTSSLRCTTNTIRQSPSNGFVAAFQTPPFSAAVETTPRYWSNYPIILSVEAIPAPGKLANWVL